MRTRVMTTKGCCACLYLHDLLLLLLQHAS